MCQIIIVQFGHFLVKSDFGVELPVRLLKRIVLLVQLVYVVEKLDVLLFGLDEGGDDFVNVVDSCGLHDGLESLLDNLRVSHILVKQSLLLDVLRHY